MVMYSVGSEHAHRYIDRLWQYFRSGGSGCTGSRKSGHRNSSTEVTDDATDAVTDTTDAQETEAQTASEGKTLVVFFSATGSTAAVAQTIADTAGADLFEITPVEPYTGDDLNWSNEDSRVSREHDDESLRNVELTQETPDNWEDYDTVLIGYPIWWGIAAWPVNNFVKDNDFTGKTVIPFCTSASSGIEICWLKWQEQVTGRMDRDSVRLQTIRM